MNSGSPVAATGARPVRLHPLLSWLLPLVAGATLPLAFAPFDLWPFALICPWLLFLVLRQEPGLAALQGWLFGVGLYGTGVSWIFVSIHVHGPAPVWLAALLTGLFVLAIAGFLALPAWLTARWLSARKRPSATVAGLSRFLVFAAFWVLGEAFRSWFLTGFPWLLLGNALIDTPLAGYAPVTGVWGMSLLGLASTGLLVHMLLKLHRRQSLPALSPALLLALIWGGGEALRAVEWTEPVDAPLVAGFVQPNVDQRDKWRPEHRAPQVRQMQQLTETLSDVDVVIWPETALPLFLHQAGALLARLDREAQSRQQALLLGILSAERRQPANGAEDYRIYNSFVGLGTAEGLYHKQKLVPFGEYVPLESLLRGLIAFFDLPMSDMARGPSDQAPLKAGPYHTMPYICYEIVYPQLVAATAGDTEFLVTVSNDTWFGESIGPLQHLQIARLRALENRKPLLRGTNNGVTALIDANGEIVARLPQFEAGVLRATFTPRQGQTPVNRIGTWPVLLIPAFWLLWTLKRPADSGTH